MAISLQSDPTLPQGYILVDGQRVASVSTTGGLSANSINTATLQSNTLSFLTLNTERIRINETGQVIIGSSTAELTFSSFNPTFYVESGIGTMVGMGSNVASSSTTIAVGRRRTGLATVVNGDSLGKFSAFGWNGTSYNEASRIETVVDDTPGVNDMPGRLVFSTTADGASTPTERMRITSSGTLQSLNGAAFYGTVSNSGNGAIMEQGSNGNGRYIRYADGTQICFTGFLTVTDQTINTPYGTLFQGLRSWTYPIAFAAPPSVNVNGQWGTSASWSSTTQNINSNTGQFRFLDNVSRATGTSFYYSAVAVGRWFL